MTPYEEIRTQLQAKLTTEEARYLTSERYIDFRQNIWVSSIMWLMEYATEFYCYRISTILMN